VKISLEVTKNIFKSKNKKNISKNMKNSQNIIIDVYPSFKNFFTTRIRETASLNATYINAKYIF
jgi:hypothetical protein